MLAHDLPFTLISEPASEQNPGDNEDSVIVLGAVEGRGHMISQVRLSYSGTPTDPQLSLSWGDSLTELYYLQPVQGMQVINFHPPHAFPENTEVTITLSAGGENVSGTLYVTSWQQKTNHAW